MMMQKPSVFQFLYPWEKEIQPKTLHWANPEQDEYGCAKIKAFLNSPQSRLPLEDGGEEWEDVWASSLAFFPCSNCCNDCMRYLGYNPQRVRALRSTAKFLRDAGGRLSALLGRTARRLEAEANRRRW